MLASLPSADSLGEDDSDVCCDGFAGGRMSRSVRSGSRPGDSSAEMSIGLNPFVN